ncbi:MAG TPA: Rieske 2Fe-2S domain-containing protein [Methanoregula sp.]|nr:Rieske 2Fe-2S domain-containing protein [Methanoregula sp.]
MTDVSIGRLAELEDAPLQGMTIKGREILLARHGDTWFAIGNVCTHEHCLLSNGRIVGENVQCPCHGSMFSLRTGEAKHRPATDLVPVYPVTVRGDEVFVEL